MAEWDDKAEDLYQMFKARLLSELRVRTYPLPYRKLDEPLIDTSKPDSPERR